MGGRYHEGFAAYGFLMALLFIYVVTGEIVAVMQSFGIILGLSEAIIGMTVLGIGNGTCDLIANWMVASRGFPNIALAAVYGGPVLNTFMGIGISMMVGMAAHGIDNYAVSNNPVIFAGSATLVLSLVAVAGYVKMYQTISRRVGFALIFLYSCFLVTSVVLEFSV